jgi:hypothetical protein
VGKGAHARRAHHRGIADLTIVMKLSQFEIGTEFLTPVGNRWRCTDVGTRTIVAIRLDLDHDPRSTAARLRNRRICLR